MDKVQQNAGTAGIVAAVVLVLLFILFFTSGLDPETTADPAKALPLIAKMGSRWAVIGVAGVFGSALPMLFAVGLFRRLRDRAPTRASASLFLAVVGLTGFALGSLISWLGGAQLVATKDQVAANYAWVALNAVRMGTDGLGSAFAGASLIIGGWAIIATRALPTAVGWLGVVAGVVTVLLVLAPASPALFFGSFILTIIWLAWAGNALRRGPR